MIEVVKRNGNREPLEYEKINKVLLWATEGLKNVSASEIALKAELHFHNGMSTEAIHTVLVQTAAELISIKNPDYQYVAARLLTFDMRKRVFGKFEPNTLSEFINSNLSIYDKTILESYSEDELELINSFIDHNRDFNFAYAGLMQIKEKYLLQNKISKEVYEVPQFVYAIIGMIMFHKYDSIKRIKYVKKFYEAASTFKISLPTPIMMNVRTQLRQYSSCVLIDIADSILSWYESNSAVGIYTSQSAGIGLNAGRWRGINAPVKGGRVEHTGSLPVLKMLEATVKSCTQGGARGGSATVHYPFFHWEIEDIIVMKNNKGTEENRVRHLDYSIQLHKVIYERYMKNENITLFSNDDVPELYAAFTTENFEEVYKQCEKKRGIRKKQISAQEFVHNLLVERFNTGRVYIMNIDHTNSHSSFLDSVYMSNLCQEITLPTSPIESIDKPDGEIALCILSNINMGVVKKEELADITDLLVRFLDELIDFQKYPLIAAENSAKARRSLGIGVMNYAYFLAKNDVKIADEEARSLTHSYMEHMQYYLIKASVNLAKEKGKCSKFERTKYSKGILPIDTYKKEVDEIAPWALELDWETLRKEVLEHGMRNSALSAIPPSETSAVISNSTNGVDPIINLMTIKKNKNFAVKQLVPKIAKLHNKYDVIYEHKNNIAYLQLLAIMQKFLDQSISTNTYYNPELYEGNNIPMTVLVADLFVAYRYGLKTLYYCKTKGVKEAPKTEDKTEDESQLIEEDSGCASGACAI